MLGLRIIVALAFLTSACGPAVAPRSLGELEALVRSPRAERAEDVAVEAWTEGMRYLRLSRDALADGDGEQSDRFAELGIVHAKIAVASTREILAAERLETARRERHDIELELERVESDLTVLERVIERERIRAHLEQVVDETRRKAAADEELREHALDEQERKSLGGARLEVARELVGRAAVGLEALLALAAAGALIEERVLPTQGALKAARDSLERGDLAAVQEHSELAGVETRRIWDELWAQREPGAAEQALTEIEQAVKQAGLEASREDLGIGVMIDGSIKGKGLDKQTRASLGALAGAVDELVEAGRVRVLVVAVDRSGSGKRGVTSRRSDERSAAAAAVLVEAGLEDNAVFHSGFGAATPLEALLGGKSDRIAVLLVPVPGGN
ncbi:MAG: hypothetical protein JRF63_11690 [Deltaproteobacteria bacterium]|nr:hypothetical protein [Deltaproteobacteria bacterium]